MASSSACARIPLRKVGYGHNQTRTIAMLVFRRRHQCKISLGTPSAKARFFTAAATRYRSQEDMELRTENLSVTQRLHFCFDAHSPSFGSPEMPTPFQVAPTKSVA